MQWKEKTIFFTYHFYAFELQNPKIEICGQRLKNSKSRKTNFSVIFHAGTFFVTI